MKMHEINRDREQVVLLLHPMLSDAEMMRRLLAEPLGDGYRYLIPDFSGHGEAADTDYKSAAGEAAQIAAYLEQARIREVHLAYGASMGAVVLMELLHDTRFQARQLFFEGASLYTDARAMNFLMKHILLAKHHKACRNPERTVQKMGQLYGEMGREIMAQQMLSISDESLIHVIHDCGFVHLPALSPRQQKHTVFAYGEKDFDLRLARKVCPRKYPQARLRIWPGYGHCMHPTEDPAGYAAMLKQLLIETDG